jgi:hypothetical protein
VVAVAVVLGVSFSFWLFGDDESEYTLQNQDTSNSLVSSEERIAVPIGTNPQVFMRNILAAQPKPTTVVAEVYPTSNVAGDDTEVATDQVLLLLDWQASGSFLRNITDINFGFYRDREPFIVLKVNSFDTAFGGILEWENFMSADLSPLFGAPVSGTFDPQSRSATQIREPFFVDEVTANLDTRVLRDETQKERIAYTFLGRDTILITANSETLRALVNVIR